MYRHPTKPTLEKEAIIAGYIKGESTFRKLGLKHGVDFRILHTWVAKFPSTPSLRILLVEVQGYDTHLFPQDNLSRFFFGKQSPTGFLF
jgi:hypothetical protein